MTVTQISCKDAFDLLINDQNSLLIDVRTKEEANFVGIVDASDFFGRMAQIQWKFYPDMKLNQKFEDELNSIASKNFNCDIKKDLKIFFLCRSGGRSDQAAYFANSKGYDNCYNIVSGFEGDLDNNNHRSLVNGWKSDKLPWVQS